jgi:hypothetical protein
MNKLLLAGALTLSFVLGGITTLVGFPRQPNSVIAEPATISPEDLTRTAKPMPQLVIDSYH